MWHRTNVVPLASHAATPPQEAVPVPGATAQVRGDGDCLRLRESPSLLSAALACITDASLVTVLEGPVTADGHDWVRVQSS